MRQFEMHPSNSIVRQKVIRASVNTVGDKYFGNLFTLIHRDTRMMYHYLTNMKKNEPRLNKYSLHFSREDQKIEYKLTENRGETKNILGFDCFKLSIEEILSNKKERETKVTQYELFVTDKLTLPARIVVPFREPITELCALEIKTIHHEMPNSYSLQTAIDYTIGVNPDELLIPDVYKHLDSF